MSDHRLSRGLLFFLHPISAYYMSVQRKPLSFCLPSCMQKSLVDDFFFCLHCDAVLKGWEGVHKESRKSGGRLIGKETKLHGGVK